MKSTASRVPYLMLLLGALQIAPTSAAAADPPLGADEAVLLLRFVMVYDPQMGTQPRLRFRRLGSDEDVVVFRQSPLQAIRVPAGRYYIAAAESGIYDSAAVLNPPPDDPSQTLEVLAGSAVYIGDYVFDEKRKLTVRYTRASLQDAAALGEWRAYPLRVAKLGAATLTIARE